MTKKDFLALLAELVESPPGTLQGHEKLSSVAGWDSMAVVGFIALVDQNFGIQVDASAIANTQTVDDLVKLLGGRVTG